MTACDIFDNLSLKLSNVLYERKQGDRNYVNKILDSLNSLDYRYNVVNQPKKAVLLLNQCCSIIPPDDSFLVAKYCHLMNSLITRQKINVEGTTMQMCIRWCLEALKSSFDEVIIDILMALEALLHSSKEYLGNVLPELLSHNAVLLSYAEKIPVCTQTLLAVQCLESCIALNSEGENVQNCSNHLKICFKIFLKYLMASKDPNIDDLLYCKLQSSCLRGLQNIILQDKSILDENLGLFLGICRSYMMYQIKGVDFCLPQKLAPSLLSVPETPQAPLKKGGKIAKQRKQRTPAVKKESKNISVETINQENVWSGHNNSSDVENISISVNHDRFKASDSDFSDSESGLCARVGINEARLRQYALQLLLAVIKNTEKPIIFGYWSSFLPDSTQISSQKLTVCFLKDPSAHGRSAALVILFVLLTKAKLYLSQAELTDKQSSFTSFSLTLGLTIKHLHHCLCLLLNAESSSMVIVQALKCISALVQSTPYHRLVPGLITKIVRNIKVFIHHRDASVQSAALIVLGCIVASEPTVPETLVILKREVEMEDRGDGKPATKEETRETPDDEFYDEEDSDDSEGNEKNEKKIPWILNKCLKNLNAFDTIKAEPMSNVSLQVKEESLQVIAMLYRHYFAEILAPHLGHVTKALENCFRDQNTTLQKHAGKAADFIAQAIQVHFSNAEITKKALSIQQGLAFWNTLLNENCLLELLRNEQDSVCRSVACDCLSNIGPDLFEQLLRDKQLLCITQLFNCTRDEENVVRGAAVRALGICVLYPSLREDIGFVMDTAEAICRIIEDKILAVRVKASWSMGNLSDALFLNKINNSSCEQIPPAMFLKLMVTCTKITEDNEKIKSNAVRALGSFMYLITNDQLKSETLKKVSEDGVKALVKCCSSAVHVKVRWNTCYGIGNMLKNDNLFDSLPIMQQTVFPTLSSLVIDFKNFKVRINAASALAMPTRRQFYGDYYNQIWKALLQGLENSQNMEDFNEYKHRDHLVDQICLTVSHLVMLLAEDDLIKLNETLVLHFDCLKVHMSKVQDRLLPEKSTNISKAVEKISNDFLKDSIKASLNGDRLDAVRMLKEIYFQENHHGLY